MSKMAAVDGRLTWLMGLVSLLVLMVISSASAHPQYGDQQDPAQNWEAVILSRNGPSTTTTPRPKVWTTTTLRSFGIAPLQGTGTVVIEQTNLAPARKKYKVETPEDGSAGGAASSTAISVLVLTTTALFLNAGLA
jgi:hypothetical protein